MNASLERMLHIQRALQEQAYGVDFTRLNLNGDERAQYLRDNTLALIAELYEALDETGWKPWATKRHLNVDAYIGELVDAWHFFMNLMLATGLTPEELSARLTRGYAEKSVRNARRQADGYDGVTGKCGGCKRALDDQSVKCTRTGDFGWCVANDREVLYRDTVAP